MARYQMTVISPDNRLKREIKRVTSATNATAVFLNSPVELEQTSKNDLVIYDARRSDPPDSMLAQLPRNSAISYVLASDSLQNKIALMQDERVCSLLCHDDRFDDDEFIASATKALRLEIFGLQKYFPWGVTTFSMVVQNNQKTRAVEQIMNYAREAGVRGLARERIQLVADELMINALYHSPVDEHGNERFASIDRKELGNRTDVPPIEVQYGCSGRYFGVSARDGGGSLSRVKALEYLRRVQRGGPADIESKPTGAGLGLQTVFRSVSKLVFNLQPGSSTEVIALFDLELFARGQVGARSVHLFVAPPDEPAEDEDQQDHAAPVDGGPALPPAPVKQASAAKWLMVVLLAAVAAVMGTALFMKNKLAKPVATPPPLELRSASSAADETILFKGQKSGAVLRLDTTSDKVELAPTEAYEVSVEPKSAEKKRSR